MSLRDPEEKEVWESLDDAYARTVKVYQQVGQCHVCHEPDRPCLSIDTSDDEYLRFECCAPCFVTLLGP